MGVTACRQSVMLNTQKNHHAMKDSFVLHVSQYRAIGNRLSLEQKGRLLDCLFMYVIGDNINVDDDPMLAIVWAFFKQQLDIDIDKYEQIKKKRSEAGKKGNQTRWSQTSQKVANIANAKSVSQKVANIADNVNVNVNVNDNVNNNNVINKPFNKLNDMSNSKADLTQSKSFKDVVLHYFNEKMANKAIKQVRQINNQRSEWLMARVKEYGKDAIFEMIDKAAASNFLNGRNGRGFVATFDWLMRPNNFPKVIDGNYDNDNNAYGTGTNNNKYSSADNAERERLERQRSAYRLMQRLAAEDGGDPLPPLEQ